MNPRRWALAGATFFAALSVAVVASPSPLGFDGPALRLAADLRSEGLTQLVLLITRLGGSTVMMPAGVLLFFVALKKDRRLGLYVGVTLLGSFALNQGLKALIDRPRPELVDAVYSAMHASFPSGHSQASTTFVVSALVVFAAFRGRVPRLAIALGAGFALLVGLSRVYLGVHYPTDILAGWTLGLLIAWAGFVALKPLPVSAPPPP